MVDIVFFFKWSSVLQLLFCFGHDFQEMCALDFSVWYSLFAAFQVIFYLSSLFTSCGSGFVKISLIIRGLRHGQSSLSSFFKLLLQLPHLNVHRSINSSYSIVILKLILSLCLRLFLFYYQIAKSLLLSLWVTIHEIFTSYSSSFNSLEVIGSFPSFENLLLILKSN